MISDLSAAGAPADIAGDICVVGSGPAGLTLALELAGKGRRVVLLEAGGEGYEADTQELYKGSVKSGGHIDIADSRLRQFGGTSGHWTGLCAPLDPIDFEPRSGSPHHGWPIRRADLDPYYLRAQSYLDLGPSRYGWTDLASVGRPLPLDPARVEAVVHQQSPPTRYAEKFLETARAAPRVDCWLHANLVDLTLADGSDRIESVTVATLDGVRTRVTANVFVIACGAVENARILLNARRQWPAGIGNEHGVVGRYFTDHMTIQTSLVLLNEGVDAKIYYAPFSVDGAQLELALKLHPEVIKREGLNNNHAFLNARYDDALYSDDFRNYGWTSFAAMLKAFSHGRAPDRLAERYCDVMDDVGGVATGVYRHVARRLRPPDEPRAFTFRQDAEQAPNPDSRVTLANEKDRFDLNRAALDWRVAADDFLKLRRTHELIGAAIGAAGLGRIRLEIPENPEPGLAYSGYHHMGTTRMHADPAKGVVDADCRVHSVKNLYMAGSSVFTTGGASHPTLTIVALAIRLADHLAATA